MKKQNHFYLIAFSIILPLSLILLMKDQLSVKASVGRNDHSSSVLTNITSDAPGYEQNANQSYSPDRLIVKFRSTIRQSPSDTGFASLNRLMNEMGCKSMQPLFQNHSSPGFQITKEISNIYVLKLHQGVDIEKAVQAYSKDANVEWAEPDFLAYPSGTIPDDPLFSGQWGLDKIQAPTAWDIVTGSQTVAIAVIDSGIDKTHSDLSGKLWINPGEIAGNGLDDDNNGFIDDVNGWDFVNHDNDPGDDNGHGTQTAGIAAADSNDATGIAGLCWNCRIMPVKVMQSSGVANYSDIASGVIYAAQKGAKVLNLSLGGYSYSSALQTAVHSAVETYGAVVVAGAGNDNLSAPFYPAAYTDVIAVAGTTDADEKAGLSNYGSWVDVSAPATNITTTFLGNDWGSVNGTSFAAPFVSGLAGLLRSQHPDWDSKLIKNTIEHTADPIDLINPSFAGTLGSGRINAANAVQAEPQPDISLSSTQVNGESDGKPTAGEVADLDVTLANSWLEATDVTGVLSTTDPYVTLGRSEASFGSIPSEGLGTSASAFTFTIASAAGYNHPIPLIMQVHANNDAYLISIPITITTRSSDEFVGGTIGSDTLWTNDKTYILNSHIGVAPGVTLTIQPGTKILFSGNYHFNIGGTLIADGTENQPIRFQGQTGVAWQNILFDEQSVDAIVDEDGDYQSGNILRWVRIEDNSEGIDCLNASPYFSHLDLRDGNLDGSVGATPLWVKDSIFAGGLQINGSSRIFNNTATGISVGSHSLVWQNAIVGNISASDYSEIHHNVSEGNISVGQNGHVYENQVSKGYISVGILSTVMTNTLISGGISAGNGSVVNRNNIQAADGWGINSSGYVTVTNNRVVGGENGIGSGGGIVKNNLIANNTGIGLQVNGNTEVMSNTFNNNGGTTLRLLSGTDLLISGNNLEGNHGSYDIENLIPIATLASISAQNNWWGDISDLNIAQRIFDFHIDYDYGTVVFSPKSSEPVQDAPAYVRSLTLDPASPVGIETVAFDVLFSKPMSADTLPELSFQYLLNNIGIVYNPSNSPLPTGGISDMAIDKYGSIWIGMDNGLTKFDGENWITYTTANSGLPNNYILSLASALNGDLWIGTNGSGAARYNGSTWQVFNKSNSGIQSNGVDGISIAPDKSIWFSNMYDKFSSSRFDGAAWTSFEYGGEIIDFGSDGSVWVLGRWAECSSYGSLWRFDGLNWTNHRGFISYPNSLYIDKDGIVLIGTTGGVKRYDGSNWTSLFIPETNNNIRTIAQAPDGSIWYVDSAGQIARNDGEDWEIIPHLLAGTGAYYPPLIFEQDGGAWFGNFNNLEYIPRKPVYHILDQSKWINPQEFQASYEISSLVERLDYRMTIESAAGQDQIEIAPNTEFTFTVDYAGAIGDTTVPPAPYVEACSTSSMDTLSATWSAHDPDSEITLYSYAIGTIPGGSDIINWTSSSSSDTSFLLTGLGLIPGQYYYVSIKARNSGGLWSSISASPGILPGSNVCNSNLRFNYLPLIKR